MDQCIGIHKNSSPALGHLQEDVVLGTWEVAPVTAVCHKVVRVWLSFHIVAFKLLDHNHLLCATDAVILVVGTIPGRLGRGKAPVGV